MTVSFNKIKEMRLFAASQGLRDMNTVPFQSSPSVQMKGNKIDFCCLATANSVRQQTEGEKNNVPPEFQTK